MSEEIKTPDPIAEFSASVANVRTMADGSPRFVLDAPEAAIALLSKLAQAQADGKYLYVMVFDADEWENYFNKQIGQN